MSCGNLYVQRNESHKGNACVIIGVKQGKDGNEGNVYKACSDITSPSRRLQFPIPQSAGPFGSAKS